MTRTVTRLLRNHLSRNRTLARRPAGKPPSVQGCARSLGLQERCGTIRYAMVHVCIRASDDAVQESY